jgi:hypothetical protein
MKTMHATRFSSHARRTRGLPFDKNKSILQMSRGPKKLSDLKNHQHSSRHFELHIALDE